MDFLAIGDTTVDEFIKLKEATVTCDEHTENCTISLPWRDKIPFEFSVLVPGVGNSANAAVCASRLGLSSGLLAHIGEDADGALVKATFAAEKLDTSYIEVHTDEPTNHHYVLWFEAERTILVKQQPYRYAIPPSLARAAPRWIYLSSLGEASVAFHDELCAWLTQHPQVKLAFQPGTFQIAMGTSRLAPLYARTDFFAVNKEEAERILALPARTEIKQLVSGLHALGPKIVVITDGRNGAYASDGTRLLFVPLYPDPRPPYERTGAGDAYTATIVAALALGKSFDEALLWGPVNAMSVVQDIGAQKGLLTREALETYLSQAPQTYQVSVA